MEDLYWGSICHTDFPNSILSLGQCVSLQSTIKRADRKKFRVVTSYIKIGWLRVGLKHIDKLEWLTHELARRGFSVRVFFGNFPDFYALYMDIPPCLLVSYEETLEIIKEGNPHHNCSFWKVVRVTYENGLCNLVISIPKSSACDLNNENFTIKFKGQLFIVRLDIFERSEIENVPDSLKTRSVKQPHKVLGPISKRPGFETLACAAHETPGHVLLSRMLNYLRYDLKLKEEDAKSRTRLAMKKFRQFKLDTKNFGMYCRHGFDFFNVEVFYNTLALECIQLIDQIYQRAEYSQFKFFILCHQEYPRIFVDPVNLKNIKSKLVQFSSHIPLKLEIRQVSIAEGCLKVSYGNAGTLKWMMKIFEFKKPWKILSCDEIPKFRCIQLALPYKIKENPDMIILDNLAQENQGLNCRLWCIAGRNPETGTLSIVMSLSDHEALMTNEFRINYLGDSYTAQSFRNSIDESIFPTSSVGARSVLNSINSSILPSPIKAEVIAEVSDPKNDDSQNVIFPMLIKTEIKTEAFEQENDSDNVQIFDSSTSSMAVQPKVKTKKFDRKSGGANNGQSALDAINYLKFPKAVQPELKTCKSDRKRSYPYTAE